jgi:hypothetical protein
LFLAQRRLSNVRLFPVILDAQRRADSDADWLAVLTTVGHVRQSGLVSFATSTLPQKGLVDLAYALTLPFAFSAFEKVLLELRDCGVIKCKRSQLRPLMEASRSRLWWQDYDLVDEARESRNALVHDRQTPSREDTIRYIDAIDAELRAWSIVTSPMP